MARLGWCFLALGALAMSGDGPAYAAAVRVTVVTIPGPPAGDVETATVFAKPVTLDRASDSRGEVAVKASNGAALLDLAEGSWRLVARASGHWGAPRSLVVDGAPEKVTLSLWPTGILTGEVRGPDGKAPPADLRHLRATFESSPAGAAKTASAGQHAVHPAVPRSRVLCPIEAGR